MRSDLAKLTTEKERRGSRNAIAQKYGGRVHIVHDQEHDYENEVGGFHSSSRHRQYDSKDLSDVLNPIRGALRKNVGRPWDKVYSEFCQLLDRRSVSGIHIFSHLCGSFGEVHVNCYIGDNGKICRIGRYGLGETEVDGFYVHPRTGILCYKAPIRYGGHGYYLRAKLKAMREDEVDIDNRKYRVINGCWFEVWLEEGVKSDWQPCWIKSTDAKDHENHKYRRCVQHSKTGEWGTWHLSKTMVVSRQRSLNSKEIKMVKKYQAQNIKEIETQLR